VPGGAAWTVPGGAAWTVPGGAAWTVPGGAAWTVARPCAVAILGINQKTVTRGPKSANTPWKYVPKDAGASPKNGDRQARQ